MAPRVRLGTQNTLQLPDIYKMFKTGTDEDKANFQNVFANLGERLGKQDQDIEFRRTMGDPEAIGQRTMGEGVGDTVGGLWDYVKKGAGKVADWATGDDAIEPNQPISSEVQGMTLASDPFAQEETMSKDESGFPIGGMSREQPTIKPQEKVFLEGTGSAPVEEVTTNETPFAQRMRERIAKLTEQNSRFEENPDLKWAELQRIDPERAEFIYKQEKDAMDFLAKTQKKAGGGADMQKLLQSALKRTQEEYDVAVKNYGANSPQALGKKALYESLTTEQQSENPNISAAYSRVGMNVPTEQTELTAVGEMRTSIDGLKANKFGQFDGLNELETSIEKWRVDNNIPVTDPSYKQLIKSVKDKQEIAAANYKALSDEDKQAYQEEKDMVALDEKWKPIYTSAIDSPLNTTREKSLAMNFMLRKETGAAIGVDEYRQKLMDMLSGADRKAFLDAYSNAMTNYIAGLNSVGDVAKLALAQSGAIPWDEVAGLKIITETYTGKAVPEFIKKAAKDMIPTKYLGYKSKHKSKSDAPSEPAPAKKEDLSGTTAGGSTWSVRPQ